MRVTETAHWLEWQDWADPVLQNPFSVVDGHLEIPNRPGIGIEWDEKAMHDLPSSANLNSIHSRQRPLSNGLPTPSNHPHPPSPRAASQAGYHRYTAY